MVRQRQPKYGYKDWPKEWIGIEPANMQYYRKFVNRELPGYCGTYAAAALADYTLKMDQNLDLGMERLLVALKPKIDLRLPYKGTFFWDVMWGLQALLNEDYQVKIAAISNPAVTSQLTQVQPRPLIVGTAKALGSKYANHWVVVYAFGYNEEGKLFYRCYDNHGSSRAVVAASQTLNAIWLERKE